MDQRTSILGSLNESEFNSLQFEKKLLNLKDSQESINSLSSWCLENRQHHKKIVSCWLNVLKRVKVEHRLVLFYLANDVIQYSKRRNYDFVKSWSTTLQKATTLVREEKVKHRILRIFKIWEQRAIYGDDFLADLIGLLNTSTVNKRSEDPQDFQVNYLLAKIRTCSKMETDTDLKAEKLKEYESKITDAEKLRASLKDRRHKDDVEKEVDETVNCIEAYIAALKAEIKIRNQLISALVQAEAFYRTERGEVKVVTNAYRNFGQRVKTLKEKLDELIPTLSSPIPSPDVNAPSPGPDSDIENTDVAIAPNAGQNATASLHFQMDQTSFSAGFYTAASTDQQNASFSSNFSSFMNRDVSFNLDYSDAGVNPTYASDPTPNDSYTYMPGQPGGGPAMVPPVPSVNNYHPAAPSLDSNPLPPPPIPPFATNNPSGYGVDASYSEPAFTSYSNASVPYNSQGEAYPDGYSNPPAPVVTEPVVTALPPSASDAYNPEEDLDEWDEALNDWEPPTDLETPESPPHFEKESFAEPIEYDDSKGVRLGAPAVEDVDHRVLLAPPIVDDIRPNRLNAKDVDHRNLISLTGSPSAEAADVIPPPPVMPPLWNPTNPTLDKDYRNSPSIPLLQTPDPAANQRPIATDQDYRMPLDIAQQLSLPPPPPPPSTMTHPLDDSIPLSKQLEQQFGKQFLLKKADDNVESVDMDLSDEETSTTATADDQKHSSSVSAVENTAFDPPFNSACLPPDALPIDIQPPQQPPYLAESGGSEELTAGPDMAYGKPGLLGSCPTAAFPMPDQHAPAEWGPPPPEWLEQQPGVYFDHGGFPPDQQFRANNFRGGRGDNGFRGGRGVRGGGWGGGGHRGNSNGVRGGRGNQRGRGGRPGFIRGGFRGSF